LKIFENLEKIQVSLKRYKNNGYFAWKSTYMVYHVSLSYS